MMKSEARGTKQASGTIQKESAHAPFRVVSSLLSAALFLGTTHLALSAPPAKPIAAAAVKLGRPVDFEKDVAPILEANCLACHNSAISESKLSVETADSIRKGGKRGPAVTPKSPTTSLLFQVA